MLCKSDKPYVISSITIGIWIGMDSTDKLFIGNLVIVIVIVLH